MVVSVIVAVTVAHVSHHESGALLFVTIALAAVVCYYANQKRDTLFLVLIIFLSTYTIFAQIAAIRYPAKLIVVAPGHYFGAALVVRYQVFVILSILAIWLLRVLFPGTRTRDTDDHTTVVVSAPPALLLLLWAHAVTFLVLLVTNFGTLSYQSQGSLKGSHLFDGVATLAIVPIVLAVLAWHVPDRRMVRRRLALVGICEGLLVVILTIRSGSRIEPAVVLTAGFTCYLLVRRPTVRRVGHRLRTLVILSLVLLLAFGFSNAVRSYRGKQTSIGTFLTTLNKQSILPNQSVGPSSSVLEQLVFQDYSTPSLAIMTSMHYNFVRPHEVIMQELGTSIPFGGASGLGVITTKLADPQGSQGFAYYILCEGYNLAGMWWGILLNGLIVIGGLRIWEFVFLRGSRTSILFITSIAAGMLLLIVRSEAGEFVRQGIYVLIPAVLAIRMATRYTSHATSEAHAISVHG
jgi:hypothetical protein